MGEGIKSDVLSYTPSDNVYYDVWFDNGTKKPDFTRWKICDKLGE